jgi:hypothetical protein
MLTIRTEQMEELELTAHFRLLDRLVGVAGRVEESGMREAAVREECARAMRGAKTYGLSTELEVAAFVACQFRFGDGFDTRRDLPFQNILTEHDTAPHLRAAQMLAFLEKTENEPNSDN